MLLVKVAAFLLAVFVVSLLVTRLFTGEQIILGIVCLIIAINVVDMGEKRA